MRFVVQRVIHASVTIDEKVVGAIEQGFLVLIGVSDSDTKEIADKMIKKMLGLRIFEDENGKTNRSLADVGGELLVVSQFTLYADCKKGNRPNFLNAAPPEQATHLYEYFVECCRELTGQVETGSFGAHMQVDLCNDGPFTIMLDDSTFSGPRR